jgi:HAE1 family hydrophobic/amphiphilic exporter-1
VTTKGRLSEVSEFENIILRANGDGSLLRLKDVARVELAGKDYSFIGKYNGRPATLMGVFLQPGANQLEVGEAVRARLKELEARFPAGLSYAIPFDTTMFVEVSIREVVKTLLEAMALVFLVVFVFLQSWRATLIPFAAVPVSLIGTFAGLLLLGYSINTLTLFGIVLATGIVVDDAIVVIENIERHMREFGKNAHDAAVDAMREVFSAVVVIGIVLVAVFLPVAFFPGTTGRMYQQFAMTITFAVILSVFNAITFTPALSALLLDKESHAHGRFFTAVNRVIDTGTEWYVRAVGGALRWKWAMAVVFALSLGATWWVYQAVPGAFVPAEDEGYFITIVQAPSGASIEYTTNIMKEVEQIYFKQPEIAGVFSVAGFSFSGAASNNGLMFTRLKGFEERQGQEHSLDAVLNRLRGQVFGIPGAMVIPVAPPSIQGVSAFGGFQLEILDLSSADITQLADVTQQVAAAGNQSGRVAGLFSAFTANDPQLVVTIDRDKARSLGLPIREVTDALAVLLGSQYVNDFDFNNRAYRVYVQGDQQFRAQPADLSQYYARASNGDMVPLSAVVRTSEQTAPAVINHFNLFRSTEITGAALPGVSSGQALQEMERIARETLPQGYDFAWAGLSLEEIKSGNQAAYLFLLSIVLVYLVLAAQYESWVLPFIILLGVPLAVFGALSAQLIRGFSNDVFCQVGLVMLIGLAAKNSILIVEFAEQLRAQGKSIVDSATEAARIRLRPILMTSFAFILGVLPLAYATGAGAGARNSVGTAVAGGMLASTFLSILFIPVLYVIIRTIAPGKARHAAAAGATGAAHA